MKQDCCVQIIDHQIIIMVLRILLVFISTLSLPTLFSQTLSPEVISSAGEYTESDDITLAWTLGEVGIQTFYADDGMFTEGFHQPIVVLQRAEVDVVVPSNIHSPLEVEIEVMPNPVRSKLNVLVEADGSERVYATLLDVTGKPVATRVIDPLISSVQIDVRDLPVGLYLLRFTDEEGRLIETFKVSKAQ